MPPFYAELPGYPVEAWDDTGLKCQRSLSCAWEDRYLVAIDVTSYANKLYPYVNGGGGAYVKNINIRPYEDPITELVPGDSRIGKYKKAIVDVFYETINGESRDPEAPDNPDGVALFEERIEPNLEWKANDAFKMYMYTFLKAGNKYGGDEGSKPVRALRANESPGLLFYEFVWHVTYYGVANVPAWVLGAMGTCNELEVISPTFNLIFAPETLLYIPPVLSRTVQLGQPATWTVDVAMHYKPYGWNNTYFKDWEQYKDECAPPLTGPWNPVIILGQSEPHKTYPPLDFSAAGILPPPPSA